jgi:sarcosine oxidase subunit gamma
MSSRFVDGIRLESPLVGRSRDAAILRYGATRLAERPFLGHINLRGDAADSSFLDCVEHVVGVALPLRPNTTAAAGERTVFWLCPDEWLITCAGEEEQSLSDRLRADLRSRFASIVQLGGGQTVIRLDGDEARELLAKGCPLDLHERVFKPGQCAQTHVAKAPVLLRPVAGGIELIVRRSFADYLWQWLETAARQQL